MKNICIIPARGGSKRIKNKNIKTFCGKPIIAYSIEAALSSQVFDAVIVSTDTKSIAEVAEHYGAQVPFTRPDKLSDDYANTFDVMQHAAQWAVGEYPEVECLCCLYATAPFVRSQDLIESLNLLATNDALYCYSVTEFEFPIQRAVKIIDGYATPFDKTQMLKRSQDLESSYHDAGQFYWGRVSAFLNREDFFASSSLAYPLDRIRVQDIDTMTDWRNAEMKFTLLEA